MDLRFATTQVSTHLTKRIEVCSNHPPQRDVEGNMHAICALGRAQKIDEEDEGICGFALALQKPHPQMCPFSDK